MCSTETQRIRDLSISEALQKSMRFRCLYGLALSSYWGEGVPLVAVEGTEFSVESLPRARMRFF